MEFMDIEAIFPNRLDIDDALKLLWPAAFYILGMAIYGFFVFKFYRFIASRDMFELDLSKNEESRYPWVRDFFHLVLSRIHRWTGMDGVRTAEGGEGVTGAMIRARIWVDGRLAGGLQALLGAPMAAYSGCGERDGGIGHGKRRSRTGLARVCRDVGLAGGSVADGRRQAGSGMARSRARARLNCSSQGQRRGRCRVNRRAERVIRPAKAKTRRLRVLVVTIC